LAETGLFNGLQRIQIKNFPGLRKTRSGCKCARIAPGQRLVGALAKFSGIEFPIAEMIAEVSLLRNKRLV
jgi:hypothetical protein